MDNQKLVQALYNKSNDWLLKCAYNFTRDADEAKELVQDVYVYLLEMDNIEKIRFNDSLNLLYIYRIIKTSFLLGKKRNISHIELTECDGMLGEDYDYEGDSEFERKLEIVNTELYSSSSGLHWFDSKLLTVYIEEDHSLTSLSQNTHISRSACWNSINRSKKYLKQKVYEQRTVK
jgi:DNA-directed RNA polymerase specialized sigma24 family protein